MQSTLVSYLLLAFVGILAIVSNVSAAPDCTAEDKFKFIGERFKFKLVEPNGKGVKRAVGGTVLIVDGCKFQISNFTISPPGKACYFYGIAKGQDPEKAIPRVVKHPLGTYNGQTIDFSLDAGTWSEMDGLAIYSEEDSKVFAKALWAADKEEEEANDASSLAKVASFSAVSGAILAMI